MTTSNCTRSRWMGFTAPTPVAEPAPAAPALSARQAAIVDTVDRWPSRVPSGAPVPEGFGNPRTFMAYLNLPEAAVAAHRAARSWARL